MPVHSRVCIMLLTGKPALMTKSEKEKLFVSYFELKNLNDFSEGRKGITVFNNLVNTKEELETNWEVPLEKCWQYKKKSN